MIRLISINSTKLIITVMLIQVATDLKPPQIILISHPKKYSTEVLDPD
jgi:hypothetical protein